MCCDSQVLPAVRRYLSLVPLKGTDAVRRELDADSVEWVRLLQSDGASRDDAIGRLHALLLRVSRRELTRRAAQHQAAGPELDDLAHQCADDAVVSVLAKLPTFRGDSRFTTWAYKFAVFAVSGALGQRYWRTHTTALEPEQWEALPDRLGVGPEEQVQAAALMAALKQAVDTELTSRQRELFVAIVVNGMPLDAVVAQLSTSRNAVYKNIFDARRKIRDFLITNGYMESVEGGRP